MANLRTTSIRFSLSMLLLFDCLLEVCELCTQRVDCFPHYTHLLFHASNNSPQTFFVARKDALRSFTTSVGRETVTGTVAMR